mgnify:CR=1 FL=1
MILVFDVTVLVMLARIDENSETAQHMRAAESILPAAVWFTSRCAEVGYWDV